jgi:Icc-related predicted phosphoesterase
MRIVALSDQHGFFPEVPACDLLIVAGDICPDRIDGVLAQHDPARQKGWFDQHARSWLAQVPATHKILTWGNHDWCGQACHFTDDGPGRSCSTKGQIVVDAKTSVPASRADGRSITIWATPWSNPFMDWAFMKPREDLAPLYAAIPNGVDILVTHQPPLGYGDCCDPTNSETPAPLGNPDLLSAIQRIRPRLVICGHIHGGYGRFECQHTTIYNVSVVNDDYELARSPTIIDVDEW